MDLYSLNDEHGLQQDDLCREVFQPISDILQPQLPGHSPSSAAAMLGDNLGDIPLPCRTDAISSDSDLMSSVNYKWGADVDPIGAEGGRLLLNKLCNEKCLQAAVLDCKMCGKVFSSVSSLSKHFVTHSQERSHVCKVCKKAFKRKNHLMGHMLTHLKVKPFMCTESGCNKSYCDFRSLRRHYEVHHGLWTKQQKVPTANPYLRPSKVLETVSVPPVLPNNDIMVTKILQQTVTSNMMVSQDPKANPVPQTMTSSKSNEDFATMNTYTLINSTSKVSMDPDYVRYSNPSPYTSLWNLPLLQSQKIQSMVDQPSSYSTGSSEETTVNGGFIETCAGQLNSLGHQYMCSPANNGHETVGAQYSFTHEPDFTRLTLQPCQNSEFQVQNFFPPLTNSPSEISHTATLSLPSMSMSQCIPETNGIRGMGDLQRDPQGLPTLSRNIGSTKTVTNGSQNSPTKDQPGEPSVTGQESRKATSSETWPKHGRSQRKSAINMDKLSLSLSSTVPASQVALESFLASNKFQGNERIYRLPIGNQRDVREWGMGIWQHKSETWTTKDSTAGHLVIPVSVPVTKEDQQKEDTVNEIRSHLQSHTTERGKKIRACPKPLYIPPPVLEKNSSSACLQSSMRSPDTLLSEYLHNGAFQCQYTPPPMLSPIRQGTGLYFNTFCTPSSARYQPPSLDEIDTGGLCLVKDNTEFSVQPHINIGDRFQAVIPECKERSVLDKEKADLVWRPCLHTEAMSDLLNLACSSAVPGGGCNLELGLHCLHFSQGNILEALDKLLVKENRKRLPRCLADYHYAGSDHWSLTEKRQFRNAYCKQWKNFSYIQPMIPGKSVYQCVEYYYTWKKRISSARRQTPDRAASTQQSFDGEEPQERKKPRIGVKVKSKNQKKKIEPEKSLCNQKETGDMEEPSIKFACQKCDRVFDKVKSRNAHMKKHRLQKNNARTPVPVDMTPW